MTEEMTVAVTLSPSAYPPLPVIADEAEKLLQNAMLREACCNVRILDWRFQDEEATDEGVIPPLWVRQAVGEKCETAMYWKEKADFWRKNCIDRLPQ